MPTDLTPRERIAAVLDGQIPDRVPYYEGSIDYPWICRLLQRHLDGSQNFDSGEYATNDWTDQVAVNRILHRDNMTYCCLPPIPAHKEAGRDQILFFADGLIKTRADVESFEMPDVTAASFRQELREFVTFCHDHDYAAVALTRCGISATYLAMGFEHFFLQLMEAPDLPEALMKRYADWTARLVPVLAEAGFDVVQTADDVAGSTGPFLRPAVYRQRFWPHVRRIADAIHATPLKWCYHSDGDLTGVLDDLVELGIHMLHPVEGPCMDIAAVKRRFGRRLVVAGNVHMDLLSRGTPEQVEACVRQLLEQVAPGGGYMLSSGNSVASYVLVANVRRMCDTLVACGRYSSK
jgi:uroporphyrinogen decarboxylase